MFVAAKSLTTIRLTDMAYQLYYHIDYSLHIDIRTYIYNYC